MIEKEQGTKNVVYEDLDSMTLINNKTINLDLYTSWFFKSVKENDYKFVYYYPRVVFDTTKMIATKSKTAFYKNSVPDTLDIRYISFLHYTETKMQKSKTITFVALGIGIPAFILFVIALFSIPWGKS
jgi:hypothetical protein